MLAVTSLLLHLSGMISLLTSPRRGHQSLSPSLPQSYSLSFLDFVLFSFVSGLCSLLFLSLYFSIFPIFHSYFSFVFDSHMSLLGHVYYHCPSPCFRLLRQIGAKLFAAVVMCVRVCVCVCVCACVRACVCVCVCVNE